MKGERAYGIRIKHKIGYGGRKHKKHYNGIEPDAQGRMHGNSKNR